MPTHFDQTGTRLVIDTVEIEADTISEQTPAAGVTIDSVLCKDGAVTTSGGVNTDTISEKTAATGVTVDGVLLKDSQVTTDVINEKTAATGVTADGVLLKDSQVNTDVINELTPTSGVTIDSVLLKDSAAYGRTPVGAVTADGAITIPAYNKVFFITKAGVAAMTIANPTATTHDGVTLTFVATTANAHSLDNSAGSGFFSSGGGTKDVATFGGAIGDGITIIAYQAKWYIDPRGSTNITLG